MQFFVPGRAVAQPRVSPGRGGHMIMARGRKTADGWQDAPIRGWRAAIRAAAILAMDGRRAVTGAVRLEVLFIFRRPQRLGVSMQRALHAQDPDFDNLAKAVCDAMNRLVWFDDAQVSTALVLKRFGMTDAEPGVHVKVEEDWV